MTNPGDEIEYRLTVANQGTLDAIIEDIKASETGSDAIKFEVTNIKIGDTLAKGTTTIFNIKISYDENITSQPIILTNTLTVEIKYAQNIGQSITPSEPVIDNSTLLLVNKILKGSNVQSDDNIDFSDSSAAQAETSGLYYTNKNTKDGKITYYFRGAVENNNVKFGKTSGCGYKGNSILHIIDLSAPTATAAPTESQCKSTPVCDAGTVVKDNYGLDYRYVTGLDAATCEYLGGTQLAEYATYGADAIDIEWRIIRINEDGSIRLITENPIAESAFNTDSDDHAYLGYMYGIPGSDDYNETHSNDNSSTIKGVIDNWYSNQTNLPSLVDKIADAGFCGDRGLAFGKDSYYGLLGRTFDSIESLGDVNAVSDNAQPQFVCPNEERDLYTTNKSSIGNKALTNPIGLITADEIVYAGGQYQKKDNNYLVGYGTWTMSPGYSSLTAYGLYMIDQGSLYFYVVDDEWYVRPVINLKSTVEIQDGGNGTATNPYVIKTS